jgi:hypothetical protein
MTATLTGTCTGGSSTTLSAQGTANGASKADALSRAREQAQTLLDSYMQSSTVCPNDCPVKSITPDPDYDAAPPVYSTAVGAADVFVCTATVARVLALACATDGSSDPTSDAPASGGTGAGTATGAGS